MRNQLPRRNLAGWAWLSAFLVFPLGPFGALYASGAITLVRASGFSLATAALQSGYVACLAQTNERQELQGWILHGFCGFLLAVGFLQYRLGARLHLWPRRGIVVWRRMAMFGLAGWLVFLIGGLLRLAFPGLIPAA